MNKPLQITLADAEEFLTRNQVRHALVGGLAVALRGQPRATIDVDMILATDVDDVLDLIARLPASPFLPLFVDVEEIVQASLILPLRHRDTGVKVDMAIGLSGFERQAVERAQLCDVAGTKVPVATAEDLIIMKSLAARPRDQQDLEGLVVAQASSIDWSYCEHVARELGEALGIDLYNHVHALRRGNSNDD
ncbi:MAG: DUF6036 family nucleotidyltransferase [Pirellulales bacterium]